MTIVEKIPTFLVVPIVSPEEPTQATLYFEDLGGPLWHEITSKQLNARSQGGNANKIRIQQPSEDAIIKKAGLGERALARGVDLFAGVARTLAVGDSEPNTFWIGTIGELEIPVVAETTRALILIFTVRPVTAKTSDLVVPVTQLIASPDPEIKNSTGG